VVVETPLANIGLSICYDGDFPELFRAEAIMGAEVIARPSALLRSFEIWELTNRARAYDNHVYIVACNGVGPDAGGNYYFGHSMIVTRSPEAGTGVARRRSSAPSSTRIRSSGSPMGRAVRCCLITYRIATWQPTEKS
jgi:predicted amidohydrolase